LFSALRTAGVVLRDQNYYGQRLHKRIELTWPVFVLNAPDAPGIECRIVDVSAGGICIAIGGLNVPKLFGVAFAQGDTIHRVCLKVWEKGNLIGAKYVSAKELRNYGKNPLQKSVPSPRPNSQ
jgi:hypothetical protein